MRYLFYNSTVNFIKKGCLKRKTVEGDFFVIWLLNGELSKCVLKTEMRNERAGTHDICIGVRYDLECHVTATDNYFVVVVL